MDLGMTLTATVLITLCALPFVLIGMSTMKHKRQLLGSLSSIATQQNCHITKHDFIGNTAIGLDEKNNYLFFLKERAKEVIKEEVIDLNEVQNCNLIKTMPKKELTKLEMGFKLKSKSNSIPTLEFYDYNEDSQLSDELEKTKKWAAIINDRI